MEALRTEHRVKRELAARVTELEAAAEVREASVEQPASPPASWPAAAAEAAESPSILRPPSPDEELARLLAEERQRTVDLQKVRQRLVSEHFPAIPLTSGIWWYVRRWNHNEPRRPAHVRTKVIASGIATSAA